MIFLNKNKFFVWGEAVRQFFQNFKFFLIGDAKLDMRHKKIEYCYDLKIFYINLSRLS